MGSLGGETAKKKAMWLYPKVLGSNPSERWGHSACCSPGVVYVFGGCCGGLHFSDVLALHLDSMVWNTLVTTGQGPGPRDSHSAVLVGHRMIVFGGTNGSKKLNDLHVLDLKSKEWIQPECRGTPPSARESHTATLIGDDKMVIFGGSGEGEANYLNDLHVLDLKTMKWTSPEVKGDVPVPRDSHSAVSFGNKLFVYGGDRGDRYHGDVDMLDMETLTWLRLAIQGSSPGVRAGHAAVNVGTKVYVIGGVGDKHYYNDVWVLDVSTCSWTQLDICGQQPQGRFSHAAILTNSDIAIYGGCGEDERPLNEFLVLQLGAEHPNGRYNISMCKIFGNHWNQEKRNFQREAENNAKNALIRNNIALIKRAHEPESETKECFGFSSDMLHPKRRRTATSKPWEAELEQEEHSLSLSQHSSSSQSDQEQASLKKLNDSISISQGFHLFKQIPANYQSKLRNIAQRTQQDIQFLGEHQNQLKLEQCLHVVPSDQYSEVEQKSLGGRPAQTLIGAEVRGKVDGAFDAGLLMTATIGGKIFRGVLFAPAPGVVSRGTILAQDPSPMSSQIAVNQPYPQNINHSGSFKSLHQAMKHSTPDSGHSFKQAQVVRQYPLIRTAPSSTRELKLRSDLQGVVLTLGGPGSGHGRS
ncbi:hypothetical protein I3760_08G153900 [Carya illinoinensis]|nr:hypothetical protein I3760_08G153900 [Carya illinoinensis]